jgi:uncharacterized protein
LSDSFNTDRVVAAKSVDMLHTLPIVFVSQGTPLVGTFYRRHTALDERTPCVVVSGSWLNVKEQMATTYARALAERGFTTLVFDFAGWGESEGLRHLEIPTLKARDIDAAARLARSMAFVGPKVGFLGVCASAQYALRAAADGAPIDALVSVAGWFHDSLSVAPFYGGDEGLQARLARAQDALEVYRATRSLRMVPAYAPNDERAGMSFEMDYYANPGRGAVRAWANEMAEMSWTHWLTFDGISCAGAVHAPTLLIHSDGCALPDNAKRVHHLLRGKKELAWLGDGTQTDYYDVEDFVARAADRAAAWFDAELR